MSSIAQSLQFRAGTVQTLQVTIGAAAAQPTQVSLNAVLCRQILVQNNAAHTCRVGDSQTSSTRGALLNAAAGGNAGGSINFGEYNNYGEMDLASIFIAGTQGDVIDVIFVI